MTTYEYYKEMVEKYEALAKQTTDGNLKTFYTNAAEGFKEKLEKLSVEKAEKLAEELAWV